METVVETFDPVNDGIQQEAVVLDLRAKIIDHTRHGNVIDAARRRSRAATGTNEVIAEYDKRIKENLSHAIHLGESANTVYGIEGLVVDTPPVEADPDVAAPPSAEPRLRVVRPDDGESEATIPAPPHETGLSKRIGRTVTSWLAKPQE